MKIEIMIDEKADDLIVHVICKELTVEIEKMLAALRMMDHQLSVKKDGETYLLDVKKIIYIESVDRKCFIYTDNEVYEMDAKLYELEKQLEDDGFFRVSKSMLIHLHHIFSLKSDINRKIKVTMTNKEQIMASRQYADALKKRLGVTK